MADLIKGNHDNWYTSPEILMPLGEFDLDPCSQIKRPAKKAKIRQQVLRKKKFPSKKNFAIICELKRFKITLWRIKQI